MPMIRLDIWGGEDSLDHLARQHFSETNEEMFAMIRLELAAGFLVNIRSLMPGEGWGPDQTYDNRIGGRA